MDPILPPLCFLYYYSQCKNKATERDTHTDLKKGTQYISFHGKRYTPNTFIRPSIAVTECIPRAVNIFHNIISLNTEEYSISTQRLNGSPISNSK